MNPKQEIYELTKSNDTGNVTQALYPKYINQEISEVEYFVGICTHLNLQNIKSSIINAAELKKEIDIFGTNVAPRLILKTCDKSGNPRYLSPDCASVFDEYEVLLIGLDTAQVFADPDLRPDKTALLVNLNLSQLDDTNSGFIYAPPVKSKDESDHLVRAIFFSELD